MCNIHIAPFLCLVVYCFSASLSLVADNQPYSFTIIDFWQRKCEEGDSAACVKLETNKLNEQKLEKLDSLASEFQEK